jgi:sigma-B regulation protein RsbU (phosphoserine phosphatase)
MLGLFEEAEFPTTPHRLEPGDTLVGFTDGVDEALDPEEQPFGDERLLRCLAGLAGSAVSRIPEGVRDAVRAFAGAAAQSDDITVLAVRYVGRPQG